MFARILLVLLLTGLAYLLFWPVAVDPLAWEPPDAPADAPPYAQNRALSAVERIARDVGAGPEAVNFDAQGRLVTGFIDGRVMRFAPDGSQGELLADTGGRPLGLDFASNGDLIVADALKGLVRVKAGGGWEVIADTAEGVPIGFADDVDVSADDIAYFSDASVKYGVHEVMQDVIESRPNGRLLATDLNTGKTRVLLPALHFANGVALGPDERYLLINETTRYRVMRYWLKGDRQGQLDVFIDNLPGFPDNITYNGSDLFWLALYSPRTADLDRMLPLPFLRRIVWRLPQALQPAPAQYGMVLGLSLDGEVLHNLQDPGPGAFAPITSVRQGPEHLYFGSLTQPSMARLPLAALKP